MRILAACLVAVCALVSVGCCTGADPKTVNYGAVGYTALEPAQRVGIAPEAKSALMIPADVLGCLTTWGADVLQATAKAGYCALNTITPPPVVQVQRVPVGAPPAAEAPAAAAPCMKTETYVEYVPTMKTRQVPVAPPPAAPVKAPNCPAPVSWASPTSPCAGGTCGLPK